MQRDQLSTIHSTRLVYRRQHVSERLGRLFTLCLAFFCIGCGQLEFRTGPLLYDVIIAPDLITPNADGDQDVTQIRYSLRRSATISIYLDDQSGERFYFRKERRRAPGDYDVFWGGVIDAPHVVETEYGRQEILSHVLSDGRYQWTIEAVDDANHVETISGEITIQDADTDLPQLRNFAVVPTIFRPNQDGLRDDWVSINYYLSKDVDAEHVYLLDPEQPGVRFFIPLDIGPVEQKEFGPKSYRYEGGVDLNAEPPPDGEYTVVAYARDLAGNSVQVTESLTIEEGGKPRADVVQGEVNWHNEMNRVVGVPLGQKLCFTVFIKNEGTVPIRTTGPWPGREYLFTENSNTLASRENEAWFQQAGVWRFGINLDTAGIDFPYRWAIGRQEDLVMRVDDRGDEQWYLMPGKTGEVNGCIVINEEPPVGTNFWWGGLIHEFVGVANNYIDRISVQVGTP
ncbi:hypothetical protein KFU94_29730 [Chloroflexi bacterium TSY]|nr:hypothetical protein [Chloroflexi bacterium TSY]